MTLERDCHTLARSLFQMRGDDALDYARRNAAVSPDRDSETARAWGQVAMTVERLIANRGHRRQTDTLSLHECH